MRVRARRSELAVHPTRHISAEPGQSGRTNGRITGSCVDLPQYERDAFDNIFDTGRTLLCQYQASFAAQRGDSGAPVEGEGIYQPGHFWFDGIYWGSNGTSSAFSAWKYMRTDFMSVTPGGWYPIPVPYGGS